MLLISLSSCKDNAIDVPTIKSPFDYSWTSDTLHLERNFQTLMSSMWASSANNVYTVGHTDGARGAMWKYDGKKWGNIKLAFIEGGPVLGSFSLSSIYGFSVNNILAAGATLRDNADPPPDIIGSSLIIHYDGNQWREVENLKGNDIFNLSAFTSNDIWAGGWNGTLFHYDGAFWTKDSVPVSIDTIKLKDHKQFTIGGVGTDGINTFALGTYYNENIPQRIYYFFRKYDKWVVADSFIYNYRFDDEIKWGPYLYITKKGKVYSYGMGGLFAWDGSSWERIFTYNDIWNIFVKENGEMFVMIASGKIFYYDNVKWEEIAALNNPDIIYTCAWATESEAFIAGITSGGFPQKTVIFHGK